MRIVEDYKAFCGSGGVGKRVATLLINPCFHSVCLFRLSSFLNKIHLFPLAKIVWYINRIIYNVDIDPRADLAGGFCIVHGLGRVIGGGVRSEGKLTVYQGVTIGGNRGRFRMDEKGNKMWQPVIKDNTIIYTNACIFGAVVISENSIIKAGTIVTEDV